MFKNARIVAIAMAIALAPLGLAHADEVSGAEINVPSSGGSSSSSSSQQSVTAPPPAHVNLQTTSIAAGLGVSWGDGTLSFEGHKHPFTVKGLSVGDIGAARIVASGGVNNIQNASDFAGTYFAVEAGAAAIQGASTLTMRNDNGVTLTLEAENTGLQLTLAAKGLVVDFE